MFLYHWQLLAGALYPSKLLQEWRQTSSWMVQSGTYGSYWSCISTGVSSPHSLSSLHLLTPMTPHADGFLRR